MWHKPCRTFHPWCLCIKTRCLLLQVLPDLSLPSRAAFNVLLTLWGWEKMDAILQMVFSNAFSSVKMFRINSVKISLQFASWVHLTISQHWFRQWLSDELATSHYWSQWWLCLLAHVTQLQWVNSHIVSLDWGFCGKKNNFLTHWDRVMHICVTNLGHDWFR